MQKKKVNYLFKKTFLGQNKEKKDRSKRNLQNTMLCKLFDFQYKLNRWTLDVRY